MYATNGHVISKKSSFDWIVVALIAVVMALRYAGPVTSDIGYIVIGAFCFLGPKRVIQGLAVSWFSNLMNEAVFVLPSMFAADRYFVLLCAAASTFLWYNIRGKGIKLGLISYVSILVGFIIFLHSIYISYNPLVSIFKMAAWLIAIVSISACFRILKKEEFKSVIDFIYYFLISTLLLSLPLLFTPAGRMVNETGFQGLFNHPQVMGVASGVLGAWSIAKILSKRKIDILAAVAVFLCGFLVLQSEARTGALSMILGPIISIVIIRYFTKRKMADLAPGLVNPSLIFSFFLGMILAIAFSLMVVDYLEYFLFKSGRSSASDVSEIYESSRGRVIYEMTSNINSHPFTGIGFGIASYPPEMVIEYDPLFDLPVSAAVEKGVLPMAVVEELGLPIALFIGFWMFLFVRNAAKAGLIPLCVVMTCFALNMAEATMFSAGGIGLIVIMMMAWAGNAPSLEATERDRRAYVKGRIGGTRRTVRD